MTENEERGMQRATEGSAELQCRVTESSAEKHIERRRGRQRVFRVSENLREVPGIVLDVF